MEIGSWARTGDVVGVVTRVDGDTVTVFNPGDRQVATVPTSAATALPTGTIEVTVSMRLDVPHGLGEASLARWVAACLDPVLRERAREALQAQDLATTAFDVEPDLEVRELREEG